jgi:hypothetical protein
MVMLAKALLSFFCACEGTVFLCLLEAFAKSEPGEWPNRAA